MRRLPVFVFLFLLFAQTPSPAIGPYQSGDQLYVCAFHGLNLRDKPSPKAQKTRTIPYGAAIVVLDSVRQQRFSVEEVKGFSIRGYWSKVRYGKMEGWIFDGYLSKYPPVRQVKEDGNWTENFVRYGTREFGLRSRQRLRLDSDAPTRDTLNYRDVYTFNNGIVYEERHGSGDGGWAGQRFQMPEFSMEECYLFFIYNAGYAHYDPKHHPEIAAELSYEPLLVEENTPARLRMEWGLCHYTFERRGKIIEVSYYCSC